MSLFCPAVQSISYQIKPDDTQFKFQCRWRPVCLLMLPCVNGKFMSPKWIQKCCIDMKRALKAWSKGRADNNRQEPPWKFVFFSLKLWFSVRVCVRVEWTDPPLCGETMMEGGRRWKSWNPGWCTQCRLPCLAPPPQHYHHTTKPHPTHTAPPSPSHCHHFFPASSSLSLSAVWHHYLSREEPTALPHHTDTETHEGHSVKVKGRERERGEHCTMQISALYMQGRNSIFFFILLFLAVLVTPKKQRYDFTEP